MQIIGEEQIFQTLFCELQLDDEQIAPGFAAVWNRAQARTTRRRSLKLSSVVASALLIACLFSLGVWLRGRLGTTPQSSAVVISSSNPIADQPQQEVKPTPGPATPGNVSSRAASRRGVMKLSQRRTEKISAFQESEIRNAVPFLIWQSPTAVLMQSPADDFLSSLPQLYRSVNEFHLFLPYMDK